MPLYDSSALIERALAADTTEEQHALAIVAVAAAIGELAAATTAHGIVIGDLAAALEAQEPPD